MDPDFRRYDRAQAVGADHTAGLKNMQQLIQLRWIALAGQIATIALVHFGLRISLPLLPMAAALAVLVAFNAASLLRSRRGREVTDGELFIALLVDVGTLTVQLYLSGGVTNPFIFLFLLQVTLGAVLLKPQTSWTVLAITGICFVALTLFHRPLPIEVLGHLYLLGLLICFALNAGLLVVFITRITHNLRARDARLADLRQRAAEEEHIVRMGLLASGAAHELGTPLATLSVILGDWRRMPAFANDAELLQEVEEMQRQVARCKLILGGILLSAGEARGDSPVETTVRTFLDELVHEWRNTRPSGTLNYTNAFGEDMPMISDSAIKQMVCNVLDNALEFSPQRIDLDAQRDNGNLVLTVGDNGPGFAPEMLAQLGKPYQSSKGRPGGGLGLFLVVNVARTLGGHVEASNRPQGGAAVSIRLPLSTITRDERDGH